MAAPPPGELVPPVPPQPPRSRTAIYVAILVIAMIVVVAGVAFYPFSFGTPHGPRLNIPAHVTAYLSNGTTFLDVPLMTLYTAPVIQNHGFESNVSLSMSSAYGGPSTTFTFLWGNVSGTGEPVRFVLTPTASYSLGTAFERGPSDGFLAHPGGNCTEPGTSQRWTMNDPAAGLEMVDHELWRMNYSVVRMAATVDDVPQSWIQVNYSLGALWAYPGEAMPAANVSAPGPADLLPVGGILSFNLSKGDVASELVEVHDFNLPEAPFRHSLPPVTLDAGTAGTLTVPLRSEFRWGPAESNRLGWSLTAAHAVVLNVQYSLDTRFGSLSVAFLP